MQKVSFDRAVTFYDQTRGFPPGIAEQVVESVLRLLIPGARLLEIGIGTGRIAKPILARQFQITGLDISIKMMQRLKENLSSGLATLHLIQADACDLPLARQSFEAVLAVHVLHLIPNQQQVLEEIRRVLKPGGSLFIGRRNALGASPQAAIRQKMNELLQKKGNPAQRLSRFDFEQLKETLQQAGAQVEEWVGASWETVTAPIEHIQSLELRHWSSTWDIPDEIYLPALAELRAWASQEFNPLDQPRPAKSEFIWQRFRFP